MAANVPPNRIAVQAHALRATVNAPMTAGQTPRGMPRAHGGG